MSDTEDDAIAEDELAKMRFWIEEAEREGDAIAEGRKPGDALDSADRIEVAQLRDAVRPEEDARAAQLVKDLRAAQ